MERRRYIGRTDKDFLKSFSSKVIRVDEKDLNGYAAYLKMHEVNFPFMIGEKGAEICFGDIGYSRIDFQPDNENWRMLAVYDNHDEIVEWYFDITRKNAVDEEGNPYCDDLYLDVALMPDGRILVLDEDELQSAYEDGKVTVEEFNMAHRVKDELIEHKIVDVDHMEAFCSRLLALF